MLVKDQMAFSSLGKVHPPHTNPFSWSSLEQLRKKHSEDYSEAIQIFFYIILCYITTVDNSQKGQIGCYQITCHNILHSTDNENNFQIQNSFPRSTENKFHPIPVVSSIRTITSINSLRIIDCRHLKFSEFEKKMIKTTATANHENFYLVKHPLVFLQIQVSQSEKSKTNRHKNSTYTTSTLKYEAKAKSDCKNALKFNQNARNQL